MEKKLVKCDVCYFKFDEELVIPKILDCGHSFCLLCLEKLVESKPNCPKCRKELNRNKAADAYTTNYLALEFQKLFLESEMESPFETMTKEIEENKEILTEKISNISLDLEEAKQDLEQLQDLKISEAVKLNLNKAKLILDKLKRKWKTESLILSDFHRLRASVNININNYDNSYEYLTEIYQRIQKNEQIYSVKNVNGIDKYGKIFFENNLLLFDALSETDTPKDPSLIWFDDLKICVAEVNFYTFLKLSCNEKGIVQLVTIKMFDSHNASKFITFCTGECGHTFKGCFYEKYDDENDKIFKGIFQIDSLFSYPQFCERIDYTSEVKNNIQSNKGDIVFRLNEYEQLLVFKMLLSDTCQKTVGKVESPRNVDALISFSDPSKLKVLESGLSFKLLNKH